MSSKLTRKMALSGYKVSERRISMPRKPKPAAIRLLEGRGPGRDSGGRLVRQTPPARADDGPAAAPVMPRNHLSLPVRKVWKRTAGLLLVSPSQDRMTAYCRAVVQQDRISVQLEAGEPVPEGTQARLA